MNRTLRREASEPITVDLEGLCALLSCGRCTARKVGEDAEARIYLGRRVLYSVEKVKCYLALMTE